MKASIIIPCKEVDSLVEDCIENCRRLDYNDFEIILLPDEDYNGMPRIKVVPTGNTPPGAKRNTGMRAAEGDILAFIDSDAYPARNWLNNASKYLADPSVAAVGGPGVTPPSDSAMQRAGGYVLSSFMVGGLANRYKSGAAYESEDIHSCNFIVKREIMEKVAWDEHYWPGEDTLVCLGIKALGKKMLEAPDVVVYHRRKPLLLPHLKQVSRFGLHRGFFAKRYPETSLRSVYLAPSLFLLFLMTGAVLSYFYPVFRTIFLIVVAAYLLLAFAAALHGDKKLAPLVWLGIILTHITYGASFIVGLLKKELKR
jgi:glycosyltransferase involved in cell wall biosynthesis